MALKQVTRQEFEERVYRQFKGIMKGVERTTNKDIEGNKQRMPAEIFNKWLNEEHTKHVSEPALKIYDRVFSISMNTPKNAAQTLTNFIEFSLEKVEDWGKHWTMFCHVSVPFEKEKAKDWQFKGNVEAYLAAIRADTAAKVFTEWIELNPVFSKVVNAPNDEQIFKGVEKMDKALMAANSIGLISVEGANIQWTYLGEKTHALTMFWRAAVKTGLADSAQPMKIVIPALKRLFNYQFGINAINQSKELSEYDEKYITLYNDLCKAMRP